MKPRILYTKHSVTDPEVNYASDAAANGWGERWFEYISRFEDAFEEVYEYYFMAFIYNIKNWLFRDYEDVIIV